MRRTYHASTIILALIAFNTAAHARDLTICQIQSNTSDGDASVYDGDGNLYNVSGGICTAKFWRWGTPRVFLQDPNVPAEPPCSDGWRGIQVKDWTYGDLYDNVNIGDEVSLTNVAVEEYRGTTFLRWDTDNGAGFSIDGHVDLLPPALMLSVSDIPAPLRDLNDPNDPNDDTWYVENHDAELYESMRILVRDVTVTEKNLGKARDNYNLQNPQEEDCWAADYMNEEVEPTDYHRFVSVGQHFCHVSGVLEQYTGFDEYGVMIWDYYQLLTLTSADLAICGDLDHDGDVDLADLAQLLGGYGITSGACFEDGDQDYDGDVDLSDLAELLGSYGFTLT